jgi:hypothetical protein
VTYSPRIFIVGPDDTLYRLARAKFSRLLDDPEHHRLSRFAGQRVRMVDAIVALQERTPCGVVRLVYEMLEFDAEGRLDRGAFERQSAAFVELLVGGSTTTNANIVDASSRFVARGGRWQPSSSLKRRIVDAALGELKCKPL